MPLQRLHARITAAIALVAVAVFAVLWIAARTILARGMIAGWIADAAGLPATIESLGIGFFPSPSVVIGGLEITQPPGFGGEPFLTVGRLHVRIPWGSIFEPTTVDEIAASDATVRLVVNQDGAANWSKLGGESAESSAAPATEPADWFIGALSLERVTIDYRDLAAHSHGQLTAIAVKAERVAPGRAFPFELSLGGIFGTNTIHYALKGEGFIDIAAGRYAGTQLAYRGWLGGEPLPLAGTELTGMLARVSYEKAPGVATLTGGRFKFAEIPGRFEGRLDFDEPSLAATFRVTTEAFAPRPPAIILGSPLPATTDPAAFESLQVALEANLAEGVLTLDPVTGRLDDTNFEASIVPAERFVRAHLDRIDFNRYLPRAAKTASTKKATLEALVAELSKLDIDTEIRVDEARIAGATFKDAVVRVEPEAETSP